MGSSPPSKIIYSAPVTQPKKGETAIYRNVKHKDSLWTLPQSGVKTVQELVLKNFTEEPGKAFLGQRPRKMNDTEDLEEYYEWETNAQVQELSTALGSAIAHLGLTPLKKQFRNYEIKFLAIYANNSREWILTDIANSLYGITTIPIYDTLGEEAADYMFNQTELTTCFLTCNHLDAMVKRVQGGTIPHLTNIVVMDEWRLKSDTLSKYSTINKLKIYTFTELIKIGKANPKPLPQVHMDEISLISYTSGTTGVPKGALISHRNLMAVLSGAEGVISVKQELIHISYLPLAHVFERFMFLYVMMKKGKYGLFNGNVLKLKDDLAILKPTIFASVPRLYNKFYDKIQAGLKEATGCKATIAAKAIAAKKENLEKTGQYTHWLYDKLVFSKMKAILGGNVEVMITASAPISKEVKEFLKIAFCCGFAEAYGQTEGLGGSFLADPEDHVMGMVGGPLPQNEFKLIDVPEMSYLSTDKDENGNPSPRGEILVRGANVIPGYYKNEEQTSEMIDKDGWLHSGDIGQILHETGSLKIIDRRKNIFKLSQGEYIAPDKLEQAYKTCRGVADIFVYGHSLKSVLVAIINVDPEQIEKLCNENGWNCKQMGAFCSDAKVQKWFMDSLAAKNKEAGLKGFERIMKIHLDPVPFTTNNLITTTFKLKRHEAKIHYQAKLDELYIGLE